MSAPASPTFTKRNAIRAVSAATRKSEASAMAAPAPATVPFSEATIGLGQRRAWRGSGRRSWCVNSRSAARSRRHAGRR